MDPSPQATVGRAPANAATTGAIFEGVYFATIPCDDISEKYEIDLIDLLRNNGATHVGFDSSQLRRLTHLISTHTDFEAYNDAIDAFIHVVKPTWVHHSITKNKATNPRQYSPDPHFFFSDVVVTWAEDVPEGDVDAIIGGVMAMGGQWSKSMTKLVTHVVACKMDNPRCKLVEEKRLKCSIVLPHWFDACLSLGKRIDETPYLLPNPPILRPVDRLPLAFADEELAGASQLEPDHHIQTSTPPDSPSRERQMLRVFRNKKVMLHDDLRLTEHFKISLASIITNAGGTMVKEMSHDSVLVCRYRGSAEYKEAFRMRDVEIGNLNWLYYLIKLNKWTSPMKRLLHYPYPTHGIPGFQGLLISLSNYQGEARVYLESLVHAAGGSFNKSMSQANTHLITAHLHGEKSDAALEWNIHRVNHLWLEESYAAEAIQSVSNPKYTTFPDHTNLGEVVGQTQIDRHAIEEIYCPKEDDESSQSFPEPEETEPSTHLAVQTPALNRAGWKGSMQTPVERLGGSEVTPASRGAKSRALKKLHNLAPDIALYEKEAKRVGGVVYGGRRVNDPDRINLDGGDRSSARKRHSNDGEVSGDDDQGTPAPSKRQKKYSDKAQPIPDDPVLTILATGLQNLSKMQHQLRGMNLKFTSNPLAKFDVLVTNVVQRTRKFLCGLACGPLVVRSDWLYEMIKSGKRLPPEEFLLSDDQSDKVRNSNINLDTSLRRARSNLAKGGVLKGWTIFSTENVAAGFETYKDIVTANGGSMLLFKGRETKVKPRRMEGDDADGDIDMGNVSDGDENKENSQASHQTLFCITDVADKALWSKFEMMAESQGFKPKLAVPEWLCRTALEQRVPVWQDIWDPMIDDKNEP